MQMPQIIDVDKLNLKETISLISKLYYDTKFEEAKLLLQCAFKKAKKADQSSDAFRKDLTKLYGFAGDILGELNDFTESLKYYESYQCLKMQLKTNLFKDTEEPDTIHLYQFRRFTDYNLANLINKELTLSKPTEMNDIVDSLVYAWLDSPTFGETAQNKLHLAPYKESFRDYRICSFCEDNPDKRQYAIQNTLMWSHYADNHKGFCVDYLVHKDDYRRDNFSEISASRIFRINYYDPDNNENKNFDLENLLSPVNLSTSDAFITKYKDWSYENEVRLLQYKPKQGALREQYKLSPNTKIVAVYFGYRCPDADIQIIKNLLGNTGVKFYKMDVDFSNVYKLQHKEV